MTWGVVVPVLPSFVERFEISIAMLGIAVASFGVGRILGNIPAGLLLSRLPARPMMRTTAIALCIVTAATALAQDLTSLIVFRTLTGVLGGALVTLCFSVLLRAAPVAARGRVISLATVVQLSAAALGSLLGGVVLQTIGSTAVFPVAAVPLMIALAWDLLRPAEHYWRDVVAAVGSAAGGQEARAPVGARLVGGLLAVTFALFVVRFAGEQGLIPVIAYAQAGLDPIELGIALAAGTVMSIAVLPLVGRWLDRGARALPVLVSTAVAGVGLVALGSLSGAGYIVAVAAVTVATSVVGVVPGIVTAERFSPRRVGLVVGVTRTTGDIGAAVGPLLAFGLADALSPSAAMWLLAGLLGTCGIAFAAVARRPLALR